MFSMRNQDHSITHELGGAVERASNTMNTVDTDGNISKHRRNMCRNAYIA